MSAEFLHSLLRKLHADPRVLAAYVGGDVTRVDLQLTVAPDFRRGLAGWLAPLADLAYSGPEPHGWTVVTADGVEWFLHLCAPTEPLPQEGLQPVFDRRPAAPAPAAGDAAGLDLADLAGAFWRDLHRAASALEQERPLTAHRWLEACGAHLINLYRTALAPDQPGSGWEGADAVPGLLAALEPVREVLSVPLDGRAQRSAAHKLAAAFEGLVLPLCERLGIAYPLAMRTLAFRRLDAGREPAPPDVSPPATTQSPGRLRAAKGRIRRPEA